MKTLQKILPVLLLLVAVLFLLPPARDNGTPSAPPETLSLQPGDSAAGSGSEISAPPENTGAGHGQLEERKLPEDGSYTTKEDVAAYLIQYGHLPGNFVTKAEARKAGWNGGSLEKVLPGKCLGGDSFANQEGLLPKAKGRSWRECDINTLGRKSRGAERLIWSNDWLIYYTDDHYESFTLLYSP